MLQGCKARSSGGDKGDRRAAHLEAVMPASAWIGIESEAAIRTHNIVKTINTIKQHIWEKGALWAQGYYIASLADGVTTDVVQEYISNQKAKYRDPLARL